MADSYQKLPGKGHRYEGRIIGTHYATSSLWLGTDHLLMVDEVYADQSVRRFYFKDIQGIILQHSNRFAILNAVFGVLMLLSLLPVLMADDPPLRIFFGAVTGFFFIPLVVNLIKGPTGKGQIVTAVHRVQIPSFGRLRNARKALAIIVPAIEAAQGRLDPDQLKELSEAPAARASPIRASLDPVLTPGSVAARGKKPAGEGTRRWHQLLYPILLAEGSLSLISIPFHNLGTVIAGFILFLGVAFFAVMAVARQDTPLVSDRLRTLTKVAVGYLLLGLVVGWVEYMALLIPNPGMGSAQHKVFFVLARLDPLSVPWLLIHLLFFGGVSIVLGLMGILWLRDTPAIIEDYQLPPAQPPTLPSIRAGEELLSDASKSPPPVPPAIGDE